jgi:hypothetical protein
MKQRILSNITCRTHSRPVFHGICVPLEQQLHFTNIKILKEFFMWKLQMQNKCTLLLRNSSTRQEKVCLKVIVFFADVYLLNACIS